MKTVIHYWTRSVTNAHDTDSQTHRQFDRWSAGTDRWSTGQDVVAVFALQPVAAAYVHVDLAEYVPTSDNTSIKASH